MTKYFWKKSALSKVKILNISGGEKKTGRAWHYGQKHLKKPYFSGETKKTWHYGHFLYIWKIFFFSPPEILSILHAWHYGHFWVIFLEKFMIFCKWTKKFFFNVNPYHFQTHAWHYGHKKKFFSKGICQLLVFFFPKKKKKNFFFFSGPQNFKKTLRRTYQVIKESPLRRLFFSTKNKIYPLLGPLGQF